MQRTSPYDMVKDVERSVARVLSGIDAEELDPRAKDIVGILKREATDARLEVRDYELAETRAEQLERTRDSRDRLESLRKNVLTASQYDIFSAIDVAQVTAHIDRIIGNLV